MKELIKTINENVSPDTLQNHPYFYHLALLRIEQVGPKTFNKCLDYFETPQQVFHGEHEKLSALGLKEKIIQQIKLFIKNPENHPIYLGIQKDIQWLNQPNHFLLSADDTAYPSLLKETHDYPPILFVIGNIRLLRHKQLAVVGSRRPSKAGALDAQYFSSALVKNGFVLTSGLASGIDSYAHEGALAAANDSTIAVLAHGLDEIFPKRNQNLAARIVNSGGALVSEFPVGVMPKPEYFPRRNRIISGLSLGVLVVEAAVKSGSLITAYCALEQNREVFAIPGSIHNPVARGCHRLIKDGAKLVESYQDIIEEFPELALVKQQAKINIKNEQSTMLLPKEQLIYKYLCHEEYNANEIAEALTLPISEVAASLMLLELKGLALQGESGFSKNPEILQK